jgi:hypothetical protein
MTVPSGEDLIKRMMWKVAISEAGKRMGSYQSVCAACGREPARWPCHVLVSDPHLAFAYPDRSPPHAHPAVMKESIERWLHNEVYAHKTHGFATIPGWPLPIGPTSLRNELARYNESDRYNELAPLLRVPRYIPHDAYAALIVGPVIPHEAIMAGPTLPRAEVTFYGLAAEGQPDRDGTRLFTLADCQFLVTGTHPEDPHARRWIDAARRWWAQLIGTPIRTGRKREHDLTDVINAARRVLARGTPADKLERRAVAREFDASNSVEANERTISRILKEDNQIEGWSVFRARYLS